jgi:hypothetical protein
LMAAETTAVGACPKANRVATDRTGRAKGLLPCGNSASGACSSPQLCILTKLRHPIGVCQAPPVFSSRLIYVNARMNSFRRDLTPRTQKDFDANDT